MAEIDETEFNFCDAAKVRTVSLIFFISLSFLILSRLFLKIVFTRKKFLCCCFIQINVLLRERSFVDNIHDYTFSESTCNINALCVNCGFCNSFLFKSYYETWVILDCLVLCTIWHSSRYFWQTDKHFQIGLCSYPNIIANMLKINQRLMMNCFQNMPFLNFF